MSRRRRELIQAKRALCYGNGDLSYWPAETLRCLVHDFCPRAGDCEQAGACIEDCMEEPDRGD